MTYIFARYFAAFCSYKNPHGTLCPLFYFHPLTKTGLIPFFQWIRDISLDFITLFSIFVVSPCEFPFLARAFLSRYDREQLFLITSFSSLAGASTPRQIPFFYFADFQIDWTRPFGWIFLSQPTGFSVFFAYIIV